MLLRDEALAQRDRALMHLREHRFGGGALPGAQRERLGELLHVRRARVAVELGRLRVTHASPGEVVGDLFGRQRLDHPHFLPRVGRGRLRRDCG
jgi:hypothetical protein